MTVKEAIASLKTLCHTCELFPKCVNNKPECYQAIELAISALEAQEIRDLLPVSPLLDKKKKKRKKEAISALQAQDVPDTNVGDLISRQAAIDAMKDWYDGMIISSFRDVEKVIKALPSAQPERKKGEWIDDNCSECGFYVYHGDMRNYCPKCGAKMNGGKEE